MPGPSASRDGAPLRLHKTTTREEGGAVADGRLLDEIHADPRAAAIPPSV
jgi:hypothetical protein